MGAISVSDVDKSAALSKLEFSGEEKEKFTDQFSKIIGFVQKISELDTRLVEPTTHAVEKKNVLREDIVLPSLLNSEIEKIAPKFAEGSIIVPKIIEY
jgi:aspartyl-tRNA(Asn)/glutamyl-tRNA(Gln) amidotransferase subunit C